MLTEYQEKWIEAIVKLTRFTQENKLKWQSEPPSETLQKGVIDIVYFTCFKGRELRLYELHYREEELSSLRSKLLTSWRRDSWRDNWTKKTVLKISSPVDQFAWEEAPRIVGLDGLLNAVRHQNTNLADFLDELLQDEQQSRER